MYKLKMDNDTVLYMDHFTVLKEASVREVNVGEGEKKLVASCFVKQDIYNPETKKTEERFGNISFWNEKDIERIKKISRPGNVVYTLFTKGVDYKEFFNYTSLPFATRVARWSKKTEKSSDENLDENLGEGLSEDLSEVVWDEELPF